MSNKNVPALERAYCILTTLFRSPWPLGISELARELNYSKSTVHGLVHTLANLGLLETLSESGRGIRPTDAVVSLWREAQLKGPLAKAARPLLTDFSENHNLTTLAGVFLPGRVLIVEAVLAPGFSVAAYTGQMVPARAGALGKALLASLPPDRALKMARKLAADASIGPAAYLAEVEEARRTKVALDREEYLEGVRALAATVDSGRPLDPLVAVWAVGLAPSLSDVRMEALAPELRALAEEVRRRLVEENQRI